MAGLAGSTGGGSTGTLATQVTDQPGDMADFESCVVSTVGIWFESADATGTETGTGTDETSTASRRHWKTGATVTTPGEAPLKFNQSFEIRADTRTVFTADFTPVMQGQTGNYVPQSVADGTGVEYEEKSLHDSQKPSLSYLGGPT